MRDTYKGESPAKKLARVSYWFGVRRLIGEERFNKLALQQRTRTAAVP